MVDKMDESVRGAGITALYLERLADGNRKWEDEQNWLRDSSDSL